MMNLYGLTLSITATFILGLASCAKDVSSIQKRSPISQIKKESVKDMLQRYNLYRACEAGDAVILLGQYAMRTVKEGDRFNPSAVGFCGGGARAMSPGRYTVEVGYFSRTPERGGIFFSVHNIKRLHIEVKGGRVYKVSLWEPYLIDVGGCDQE